MIDLKKIYTEVFKAIANDKPMLDLLGIPHDGRDMHDIIKTVREQVVDTTRPDDLLTNYATRLCLSEEQSGRGSLDETGYFKIEILITQDKNKIDRRVLIIAKRLVEILDTKELNKVGKKQIPIGLYGLNIRRRLPREGTSSTGWDRYCLVFEYKYII